MIEPANPKNNVQELPRDNRGLLKVLEPFIREYLAEIKSTTPIESYVRELTIYPIRIDGVLLGFWGVRVRAEGKRRLATLKALYLRKSYRGKYLARVADDLARGFAKQGITEVEIWAYPRLMKWMQKRYNIEPTIYITHNPLSTFQINSRCKAETD